ARFSSWTASAARCLSFFFNDSPPTEIYTLSLHDALPILAGQTVLRAGRQTDGQAPEVRRLAAGSSRTGRRRRCAGPARRQLYPRSEEHTSELQSRENLVCRLLLEKKKKRDGDQEYVTAKT